MMKSRMQGRDVTQSNEWQKHALLSLIPIITIITALLLGIVLGQLGPYACVVVIGAMIMIATILLRQDVLAVAFVVMIHLYVDWYLAFHLVGLVMALGLLLIFFFAQSSQHPWICPRALWLWALFLVLALFPAIRGALTVYDLATYYPSTVLGALIVFWLGTVIARDKQSVRRLFQVLAALGTLIAVHTLIQAATGIFVFESSRAEAVLTASLNFQLRGSDVYRSGSFFIDPNWNGTFLAMMFFLPLGLFFEHSAFFAKALSLIEAFVILLALLSTYSAGAWIGLFTGLMAFVILVGYIRYRIPFILLVGLTAQVLAVGFPSQVALLFQHATVPSELDLRVGAWQTGLRVIQAFPLTGVGLGGLAYLLSSERYRVPAQTEPLDHPHNTYLEWAAKAGLPVLCVFMVLLLFALWQAMSNWIQVDLRSRPLLGGAIAAIIALSINSISIDGWTHPVNGLIGWLILGAVSSPLLGQSLSHEATGGEKADIVTSNA
jgi:O-antigen ligase